MAKTKTLPVATCTDCQELFTKDAQLYVCCPACREKRKAAWREEHTRKPGDKRPGWLIGDCGEIKVNGHVYKFKILDMSDISRREHDHDLVKLELSKTVDAFGQKVTQTWVHPEPLPSYRLRKICR